MKKVPYSLRLTLLACCFSGALALRAADDIPLFDFESPNALAAWQAEGGAFRTAGADMPYFAQKETGCAQGARFATSFDAEKQTHTGTGSLLSPAFTIERRYIEFWVGGNRSWPDELGVELLVDGKAVRAATGTQARPGLPFKMAHVRWDVSSFQGKQARLRLVDRTPYGMICADGFVQSDTPRGELADAAVRGRERYRPAFHASTGTGRSGDPNGMFYYKGRWHLGSQLYYVGSGGTAWAHYVSDDLVHWRQQDDMVPVGTTGTAASGGAVIDARNVSGLKQGAEDPILLFYTRHPVGASSAFPDSPLSKAPKAKDTRYRPGIAYSTDGGKTFTKTTEDVLRYDDPQMLTYDKDNLYTLDGGKTWVKDPSILLGPGGFGKDRDSKVVWYEPTQDWVMIWHLSQNNNREKSVFGLYRSKDFKKWELFQTIPQMWECPDFFELPLVDKDGKPTGERYWVVDRGGVEYLVGAFDGKEFVPMTINDPKNPKAPAKLSDPSFDMKRCLRRVTFKSGCYAAQSFANAPDGRVVQFSWLSGDRNRVANPGGPWENMLSFPVELTLRDTGKGIAIEHVPVKEIEAVYRRSHHLENRTLSEGLTPAIVPVQGNLLDIRAVFDAGDAQEFGLSLLGQTILYKTAEKRLYAFNSFNEKKQRYEDAFTVVPLEDNRIELRILVDRSSIELGVNRGVQRGTLLLYPQDDTVRIDAFSKGGSAKLVSLDVHEIECEQPGRAADAAPQTPAKNSP